jgi:HK97 gp10 family phage protein
MVDVTITAKLGALFSRLSTLAAELETAVETATRDEAAAVIKAAVEKRTPVVTGELKRSLRVQFTRTGKRSRLRVGFLAPYGLFVEEDTKPHIIRPKRINGRLRFQVDGKWVFAKEVHHPGTKGQHMIRLGVKDAAPQVRQIYLNAVRKTLR